MKKLINAHIPIAFEVVNADNKHEFDREFESFATHHQDPLSAWIKLAKARGETKDNDVVLQLIVELHRKIDRLEKILQKDSDELLKLRWQTQVCKIAHGHFEITPQDQDSKSFDTNALQSVQGSSFYGRLKIPVFPQREVPVFFTHCEGNLYAIDLLHQQDQIDYDAYINAKERAAIRQMKGLE